MTAEIAIVVSPRDWAERLHRFVADHGGALVRARILDAREAVEEPYEVLIAEDLTSFLTPRLVEEVHRAGRRILGVYDPTEPAGKQRLRDLGADATVAATTAPDEMLAAVDRLTLEARVTADLGALDGRGVVAEAASPSRPGRVTVVGGPAGAPGMTEVALGLAGWAAAQARRAVLVDADDVAPALAQRLGLGLHPNLRTAIDVVQHRSGVLGDVIQPVGEDLGVLVGPAPGADRSEFRAGEVVDVVTDLARAHDEVVVDVGHRLEDLGGPFGGGRYAVSRALVADADVVVGILSPTPVGVARFLDWMVEVRALTDAVVPVVVNRAPASRFRRGEVEAELRRTYTPPLLAFLPEDRRVGDAAWAGEPVRSGPFHKHLASFAAAMLPPTAGTAAARPAAGRPAEATP